MTSSRPNFLVVIHPLESVVARVWVWYRLRRVLVGGEVVLVVLVVLVMEEEKWGATN